MSMSSSLEAPRRTLHSAPGLSMDASPSYIGLRTVSRGASLEYVEISSPLTLIVFSCLDRVLAAG